MSTVQKMIGILGFVCVLGIGSKEAAGQCPTPPTDYDCKCNGDNTRWVCATWGETGPPAENADFFVTYTGNIPEVKFKTADDGWELYSEVLVAGVPTGPADLGDVLLADDVSPDSGKFTVAITKSGGTGAVNVSSIVLNSSDVNWTGHSTFTSSGSVTVISGTVTGDITAIKDGSGGGGATDGITLIVGDVQGVLRIPTVSGFFTIYGALSCGYVETIDSGGQLHIGSLAGLGCPAPEGGPGLNVTGALAGLLKFTDEVVHATINIADFEGSGKLSIPGSPAYPQINLYNGVDSADASVHITYHAGSLYLHDKDMLGVLNFPWFGGGGGVLDGGVLEGSVRCGVFASTPVNRGTIEFASVAAGGEIIAELFPFQGNIHIAGNMAGLIKIENDLTQFSGVARGEILIDGDLTGWVECNADVAAGAEISIGAATGAGALLGTGKITVDGVCDADFSVGENTTSNTLIHCKSGLGSSGHILINASAGNFNAAGKIIVGSSSGAPITGDYDGCIYILDEAGTGNGGDLNGRIRIAVCDDETSSDPGFDHRVCIKGDLNGTIQVANSSCTNQPGYACPEDNSCLP